MCWPHQHRSHQLPGYVNSDLLTPAICPRHAAEVCFSLPTQHPSFQHSKYILMCVYHSQVSRVRVPCFLGPFCCWEHHCLWLGSVRGGICIAMYEGNHEVLALTSGIQDTSSSFKQMSGPCSCVRDHKHVASQQQAFDVPSIIEWLLFLCTEACATSSQLCFLGSKNQDW